MSPKRRQRERRQLADAASKTRLAVLGGSAERLSPPLATTARSTSSVATVPIASLPVASAFGVQTSAEAPSRLAHGVEVIFYICSCH